MIQKVSRVDDKAIVEAGYELHAQQFLQKKLYTTPPMIQTVLRQVGETCQRRSNAQPQPTSSTTVTSRRSISSGLFAELNRTFKPR